MSARVLIVGAGDAGLKIAAGLAAWPEVRHIVLADRRVEHLPDAVDRIASCGRAGVTVRQADGLDPAAVTGLLGSARPDLIVHCASLISPWATIGKDHPVARALASAGLGVQLPAQLPILRNLMACRAELGLAVPVANLSLPDLTHSVLRTQGLAPLVGLGNASIVQLRARAALRAELDHAGRADEPSPLTRVVAHHHNVYDVMQARQPADPRDAARIYVGEEGQERPDLAARGRPVAPGPLYNVITAAAALEVLKGLLPGADPVRVSAPAPFGLMGGYPLRVGPEGIALDLPDGVDRGEAERFHRRMGEADGVSEIADDGTAHFSEQARRALAGFDPRLTEPLRLDDLADRADRLQDLIAAIP